MNGAIQGLVAELWRWVEKHPARVVDKVPTGELSRLLHHSITAEMEHRPKYDPELDHRVLWVREIIRTARAGRPHAPADLRATVALMLEEQEGMEEEG